MLLYLHVCIEYFVNTHTTLWAKYLLCTGYLVEEHCINILILTYINAYHAISSTLSQVHNTQWGKSIFEISF